MTIRFVVKIGDRHYFRRKIKGRCVYRPLPDPSKRNFGRAYDMARRELERVKEGMTVGALIRDYERSPAYRQLATSTKRSKDGYSDLFRARFGNLLVSELTRYDVHELQSELSGTPGRANNAVAQLSVLLNFAVDREFCSDNVAANVKRLRQGVHKPWPDHVVERALIEADPMLRLAIITGLESAQRIGDCIGITHDQVESGLVELTQQKTGVKVFIPVSSKWRNEVAMVPKRAATILYKQHGRSFRTPDTLQSKIRTLMQALGTPEYSFHGLRKNATNRLAEKGLSPFEIRVITGMTLPTVMHYTRDINAKKLALDLQSRGI